MGSENGEVPLFFGALGRNGETRLPLKSIMYRPRVAGHEGVAMVVLNSERCGVLTPPPRSPPTRAAAQEPQRPDEATDV